MNPLRAIGTQFVTTRTDHGVLVVTRWQVTGYQTVTERDNDSGRVVCVERVEMVGIPEYYKMEGVKA